MGSQGAGSGPADDRGEAAKHPLTLLGGTGLGFPVAVPAAGGPTPRVHHPAPGRRGRRDDRRPRRAPGDGLRADRGAAGGRRTVRPAAARGRLRAAGLLAGADDRAHDHRRADGRPGAGRGDHRPGGVASPGRDAGPAGGRRVRAGPGAAPGLGRGLLLLSSPAGVRDRPGPDPDRRTDRAAHRGRGDRRQPPAAVRVLRDQRLRRGACPDAGDRAALPGPAAGRRTVGTAVPHAAGHHRGLDRCVLGVRSRRAGRDRGRDHTSGAPGAGLAGRPPRRRDACCLRPSGSRWSASRMPS